MSHSTSAILMAMSLFAHDVPLASAAPTSATQFYVSPSGDDARAGTKQEPFATVQRAQEEVRRLKYTDQYPADGVTVYLRGGRYALDEPIRFAAIDSGKPDAPVVYAAVAGEVPHLSGGTIITGWQEHEPGLWKAPTRGVFRQLYVNGSRAVRARSPNDRGQFFRVSKWQKESQTVEVPVESAQAIQKATGVEMFVQNEWCRSILRISEIEVLEGRAVITLRNPERTHFFARPYPKFLDGNPFHFENSFTLLDAPGEWYLDQDERVVYYRPKEGEDIAKVVVTVPRIETLIRLEGTVNRPVEHLVFRGLTFEESNWHRPSRVGLIEGQAGFFNHFVSSDNLQLFGRPPAAVEVIGGKNIRFERNAFRNLGATGLDLRFATHSCEVEGNVFKDIAGTAIRHGTFSPPDRDHHFVFNPKDEREICTDDTITNNYITRVAADYAGNVGIACGYVRGVRIEHNDIAELPYTGISLGWGWEAEPNAMKNNLIRYNRIAKVMQLLHDGSAIYTLAPQPGTEIAYNYCSDIQPSPWAKGDTACGIFLDEATDFVHCHHNVFARVARLYHLHAIGEHNRLEDDVQQISVDSEEVEQIMNQAGLKPAYRDIKGKH